MEGAWHATPTVVVLTALPLEFQAVREQLSGVRVMVHPQGTLFDVGRVPGLPWRVALVEVGEGNSGAAVHTERAIAFFRPAAMFFVGIAGSLRAEGALGDVVVASKVYLHHGGKEGDDGFRARPRAWEVRHDVEQRVRRALRSEPGVHFKPLVAGDVVLNSRTSRLADLIDRSCNDAVAVDMESAGLAQAAHLNDMPMLTVRGISDFADGRKAVTDAQGSQPVAARNAAAAAVAVRILRELPVPRPRPEPSEPRHAPAVVLASPSAVAPRDTADWRGGAVVTVDGEKCLLHDGPDDSPAETVSPDHSVGSAGIPSPSPVPRPSTTRSPPTPGKRALLERLDLRLGAGRRVARADAEAHVDRLARQLDLPVPDLGQLRQGAERAGYQALAAQLARLIREQRPA